MLVELRVELIFDKDMYFDNSFIEEVLGVYFIDDDDYVFVFGLGVDEDVESLELIIF